MKINRKIPFDVKTFIGDDWSIESEDVKALTFTEIDFSKVSFEHGLEDTETYITGEEKLNRLQKKGILLDAAVGEQLFKEKGQKTLRALYDEKNIAWMEFAGTVLRNSDGYRYFLYLNRRVDGSWDWRCNWLDAGRYRDDVSPLLASSTQSSDTETLALSPLDLEQRVAALEAWRKRVSN